MANTYKTTTCFEKLVNALKLFTTVIMQGGQGSGKTTSILQYFIFLALSKRSGLIMSVVGDSMPNLKSNPIRIFDKLLKDMGIRDQFKINLTDKIYENKATGNIIEFFSVETDDNKLGARRTHLYVSEATGIKFETYLALAGRSGVVIIDYNPKFEFWVHTELMGDNSKAYMEIVTYKDNEYLPKNEIDMLLWYKSKAYHDPNLEDLKELNHKDNIKSKFYVNKWRVLGMGLLGVTDGLIFEEHSDWSIIKELPANARYIGSGLDFGFTHVSAIVELYEYDNKIIMREALYRKGLTSRSLSAKILKNETVSKGIIAADESRPEMIKEISTHGISIDAAPKGAGSVDLGLDIMHSFDLLVTSDSENLIKELRVYSYATDKNGKSLGVPDKSKDVDNAIDAARYAFRYFLSMAAKAAKFTLKRVA